MLEKKLRNFLSRQVIWKMGLVIGLIIILLSLFTPHPELNRATTAVSFALEKQGSKLQSQQESVIQEPIGVVTSQRTFQKSDTLSLSELSLDERFLLKINPDHYVLQIMASFDEKKIQAFRVITGLKGKSHYYQTLYQDKPWYVLVYGDYPNRQEAIKAITELAPQVKEQNPWVQSVAEMGRIIGAK